jgi:hypothetical protein
MKIGDWIKERVREIQETHPVEEWEDRKCDFDVVVDAEGDVRLSGDTRIRFSLHIPNQRQSDGTAAPEPEFKQEADRRLPCTACCASSFRLFAGDLIVRLSEKLPGSSFHSWVQPETGETTFSFCVMSDEKDGRTHINTDLRPIIDSICERYASTLLELYPEPPHSESRQFRVEPLLGKEFHAASEWVSRWIHSSGISIRSQDSTFAMTP